MNLPVLDEVGHVANRVDAIRAGCDLDRLESEFSIESNREGTFVNRVGRAIGPLVKYYRATGHGPALDLAITLKEIAIADFYGADGTYDAESFGTHAHSVTCTLSSLAQLAVRGTEAHAGLEAGDYFVGCQPRHLYISRDSGQSFSVNEATETFSNKNALGLQFSPEGKLCAGTCDSLQCVV